MNRNGWLDVLHKFIIMNYCIQVYTVVSTHLGSGLVVDRQKLECFLGELWMIGLGR